MVTCNLITNEIKDAVWRIGPKKTPGSDGLTAAIIRMAWPVVKQQLTHLYKRCLENSIFPSCWKDADVIVLLKSKDKDPMEPKSYRPVSLLPTLAKVLETLIINRLKGEISDYLSKDQHGFTLQRASDVEAPRNRHRLKQPKTLTMAKDRPRLHPI
jgi:hypothetical protein